MKKILTLLITSLIVFSACSKKITVKAEDAFNDYEVSEVITIFTDDEIDLNTFLKDKESYDYTYNFSLSDEENDLELLEVPEEPISLDGYKEGEYILTLYATSKEDETAYATMFKNYKLTTIDEELNLSNLDKDADLSALLEKYGLKYEGDIDTSKAGVYSVKITKGDKNIGYKSVVVAKDELEDGSIVENETKNEVNNIKEDTSKSTSTSSGTLDKSDNRIALAYSWEGMSGNCESIAFNYLQCIGYLQDYSYESYLGNRYSGGFNKLSEAIPFVTLIEYDNGAHVAVYLGEGMALHGNYSGKAKVASMYLSDMAITSYYDMATTKKSSLVEEGSGSSSSSSSSSNSTSSNNTYTYDEYSTTPNENIGLGAYLYTEDQGNGSYRDYYEYGYADRYIPSEDNSEYKKIIEERGRKVQELAKEDHDPDRCYLIADEYNKAYANAVANGTFETDETLMEIEGAIYWCDYNGYEIKMD